MMNNFTEFYPYIDIEFKVYMFCKKIFFSFFIKKGKYLGMGNNNKKNKKITFFFF